MPTSSRVAVVGLLTALLIMQVRGACDVNTTIISVKENVPVGTVIMSLNRESGEQWSFREDGPRGYIQLNTTHDSVVFFFAKSPDLEQLSTQSSMHASLPFTLECSFDGWQHVFKQSIVLMDINDNDPRFHPARATTISVNENTSPGTTILPLHDFAIDPDASGYVTAYDVVPHGDLENDGFNFFSVSGTGKDLVVKRQLDFDQMRLNGRSFFLLNITAMDNGYPEQRKSFTTLQVNVTDSDDQGPAFRYPDCPLIEGYCTTPLFETVAQKSFTGELKVWPGPIKALDRDSMNNTILYYVVKVSPEKYSAHFKIDAVTGKIRVTKAFQAEDIDAIHVTIKAEENSMTRRFLTTTLRVQVVGDYYASYRDTFRNVPVNQGASFSSSASSSASASSSSQSSSGGMHASVPISLFVATVAVFFIIVVSFPFVMVRVIKSKLQLVEGGGGGGGEGGSGVTSLQLNSSDGGGRKESSDTTTISILTCTSNDTGTTIYGPPRGGSGSGGSGGGARHQHRDSDASSTTSSSSAESSSSCAESTSTASSTSSSTTGSPVSSVRLDFHDAISFASPAAADSADHLRGVTSVAFDPEEVSSRFSPPVPLKLAVSSAERFRRRVSRLFSFNTTRSGSGRSSNNNSRRGSRNSSNNSSSKDKGKSRVRFDIRNVSNFS